MDAHATGADAHAVVVGDLVSNLAGAPSARAFGNFGACGFEHGRRHVGGVTAARLVGQGIKAASDEGFNPEANGLLMDAKVAGDLRHTPASIGEADHFKAITGGGGNTGLARAARQLLALVSGQ